MERIDQRSDVFSLGAILCEILTGQPPFTGTDFNEVFNKAKACDRAEAMARLDSCGVDVKLLRLAKACLAREPGDRPGNAGTVAKAVTAYLAGVQEQLVAAERERAAAQARAEEARKTAEAEQALAREEKKRAAAEQARAEAAGKTAVAERRARRRMAWAAVAVLLLVVGTGSGAWWQQQKQEQADQAVLNGLAQAQLLEKQAQETPLEPGTYHQAVEAARVAAHLAEGTSIHVRVQAKELVDRLKLEEAAADRDRRLLTRLLDVRGPREGPKYSHDGKGMMLELTEPPVDEQFAAAFLAWGLDVDTVPTTEVASRLKGRPLAVVMEVIAALDEWASQRRQDGKPEAEWRRLADLAAARR